jgi:SAM-dependent methyltransferase
MNLSFYLHHTGTLRYLIDRVVLKSGRPPKCWRDIEAVLRDRDGAEIGGPSPMFEAGGELPLYPIVRSLENYGFQASAGTFAFSGRSGSSHACEASALPIRDASCDFVLSSHVLEHMANPLQALQEWRRVLKPNGHLLVVLPHRARTFDHKRKTTSWDHLLADFAAATPETDRTHIAEALELTDTKHWTFNEWPGWRSYYENNVEARSIHHHVFDMRLAKKAVTFSGLRMLVSEMVFPFHLVLLAAKQP